MKGLIHTFLFMQMMLVQFKTKTIDYAIIGEERNREKLPFQTIPNSV